jgi:CBS domain-containing protein
MVIPVHPRHRKDPAMQIADILNRKGHSVYSVLEWQSIREVVEELGSTGTGALIVLGHSGEIRGIVSERDIVRALRTNRTELLQTPVSEVMTRNVTTVRPDVTVAQAMAMMTKLRHRHLPVLENGKLIGVVSIGDLVKHRVAEMEMENVVLRDAAIARY